MEDGRSYSRFYMLLKRLPCPYGEEALKRQLVSEFTGGRTTSLKEMSDGEYRACCEAMQGVWLDRETLRKKRSLTLKLMQKLGVDTTDWAQVNSFCRHPRIAGKAFCEISIEEHGQLQTRLRTIERKGWQRRLDLEPATPNKKDKTVQVILIQPGAGGES